MGSRALWREARSDDNINGFLREHRLLENAWHRDMKEGAAAFWKKKTVFKGK